MKGRYNYKKNRGDENYVDPRTIRDNEIMEGDPVDLQESLENALNNSTFNNSSNTQEVLKMDENSKTMTDNEIDMRNTQIKQRFDAMTGEERKIVLKRFTIFELHEEIGRRLKKQDKFSQDIGGIMSNYLKED